MKRLEVINETYYNGLIGILSALVFYNICVALTTFSYIGLLPILIQSALIYLLITKNTISEKAIKIWLIVFFFAAPGIKITGIGMQAWAKYMKGEENALEMLTSNKVIYSLLFIVIGIIIRVLNKDFGELRTDK
ncbi:MAG: hypothetical protein ACI9VN_003633 [Patescibacteria group bacterium]|jgi:hypothetical protein